MVDVAFVSENLKTGNEIHVIRIDGTREVIALRGTTPVEITTPWQEIKSVSLRNPEGSLTAALLYWRP